MAAVDVLEALDRLLDPTEIPYFAEWKDDTEGADSFLARVERCPDCLPHAVRFWRLIAGQVYSDEFRFACMLPDKSFARWPVMLLAVVSAG